MQFAQPHLLWLMLPTLVLLGWFLVWTWRKRQRLMTRFIQARLLAGLTVRLAPRREQIRRILLLLVVALLFLSLARPQWGYSWEEARRRGLDIVVAVDTSRSMLAQDLQPNRLERAKLATLDLLREAAVDRLGLVAFAGSAFLQCPLTLDDQAFRQSLATLNTRVIPQGGTAMAEAIHAALGAFKDEDNFKVLILLSDGEDHDDRALDAAREAAEAGVRIFTLGVGTKSGEVLRAVDEDGQGFYLPLAAPNSIDTLYTEGLAPLPRSEISSRLTRRYHERFYWPLGLAIFLLAIETVLPRARRDRPASHGFRNPPGPSLALIPAVLGAVLATSQAATTSPGTALEAYDNGQYQTALEAYEQLLEKNPDDPRLSYNLGTTAYQAGDFPRAAQAFTNALTAPKLTLQQKGFYNLGNTLFRLGEATTDLAGKSQLWSQATNSFQAALQLDPSDADAQNNLDYVRRRLEELQQQQEQQQQQSDDQGEDNPEQQDQSENEESTQDQQQQKEEPEESSSDQNQSQEEKAGQDSSGDTQEGDDGEEGPEPRPTDPNQNEQENSPPTEPDTQSGSPDTPIPGQMTPQEARQLLDAQKDNERTMIFLPNRTNIIDPRILKDW
jgi:Ca-activated chloride channel family protein